MQASKTARKSANQRLPDSLHERVVDAFVTAFQSDTSPKGVIQAKSFLLKYCETDSSSEELRRKRAIEKWLATEDRNKRTNHRLKHLIGTSFHFHERRTYGFLIDRVRATVRDVIGDSPSLDPLYCGFSGGASTSRTRDRSHPALKFLEYGHVTRSAYPLFYDIIRGTEWERDIRRFGLDVQIVQGNVLFTVPKNAEIDRVAAKEPDLNIFMQKSFGQQIRYCLRRTGINLNDQTRNSKLAQRGSRDGSLATLDLSSASDSVCNELCRLLLPSSWYYYLDLVRSPITIIDGQPHENEMFSSMGNGFTFELESLLFYAIAKSVAYITGVRGTISVYGDDIICPVRMYENLIDALEYFGFSVNQTKSFASGPFRESCGGYWYDGADVKPFFLRRRLTTVSDLILLLNSLIRWAQVELPESSLGSFVNLDYEFLFNLFKGYVPEYLHGGQDLSSRYSLVTGDSPRKELKPITVPVKTPDRGSYLYWLLTNESRAHASVQEQSIGTRETGNYRLRRAKQCDRLKITFLTRYGDFSGEEATLYSGHPG